MTTHPNTQTGLSQCDKILGYLSKNLGEWIAMPILVSVSGSYAIHSRISDLRKQGHKIEHQQNRIGRSVKSYYRLQM